MKPHDPRSFPLLAADPVALAIAEGRQRQHRQPMKPQPDFMEVGNFWAWDGRRGLKRKTHGPTVTFTPGTPEGMLELLESAPWRVGDSLYVRECWAADWVFDDVPAAEARDASGEDSCLWYRASPNIIHPAPAMRGRWRPNILCPEWAARTWVKPTRVWAERVQDISEEDARAEGCLGGHDSIPGYAFSATPREHFRHLWESLYPGSWERNDWVWCCSWDGVEVRT